MEYKFRAWDKDNKRMEEIDGCNLYLADGKVYEVYSGCWAMETTFEKKDVSDRYIPMQYTGVKERYPQMVGEGQEIYFGDIVRVFGGEYCQGYYEHDRTIIVESVYDIIAMEESENVQLLGNKWDNPELLKEESI